MNEFDITLKLILRSAGASILRILTGGIGVERWLNVQLHEMQ